jgi:hypothetical protein
MKAKIFLVDSLFYKEPEYINISVMQAPRSRDPRKNKLLKIAFFSNSNEIGSETGSNRHECLDASVMEPALWNLVGS